MLVIALVAGVSNMKVMSGQAAGTRNAADVLNARLTGDGDNRFCPDDVGDIHAVPNYGAAA